MKLFVIAVLIAAAIYGFKYALTRRDKKAVAKVVWRWTGPLTIGFTLVLLAVAAALNITFKLV